VLCHWVAEHEKLNLHTKEKSSERVCSNGKQEQAMCARKKKKWQWQN
jgi:hypothetical protein